MNFTHEGLSLWYGTPDAPAPGDAGVVPRRGASLIVGVKPANPTNTLVVRYRVDAGREQSIPGRQIRTDYARETQYFSVTFPDFVVGNLVEYVPVLSSAGRLVPPRVGSILPSKFQLAPIAPSGSVPARATRPTAPATGATRFEAGLDFVARVSVRFSKPEYLTDTASGMRVNFFVEEGSLEGNGFSGSVIARSSDHLLVRRDGMGVVRIRAGFATTDGARLDVEASGYVDFGPDGHRRALAHDLPDRAPIVVAPLVATRHPRYRWLSRVQCIGTGHTNLAANRASYCVYATSSRPRKA